MAFTSENLFTMRAAVKQIKPNASSELIVRSLNKRVRDVITKRYWSDLLRFGYLAVPAAYNTGTVAVTAGSATVTGTGTTWPVNDDINTSAVNSVIKQPGVYTVTPAVMTRIIPGISLVIDDPGGGQQEVVTVISVGPGTFTARFTKAHVANFTIVKSTFAGRQFRTSYPFYTVSAVTDPTSLLLDAAWAGPAQSGVTYQVIQVYFRPDPYCWRIKHAWDPAQGISLDVDNHTIEKLLILDPQMTTSDNPTVMVSVPPGPAGTPQWMLYPPQSSARQIGIIYAVQWPAMVQDNDVPPPFINPEVFIAGAAADCLRIRTLTEDRRVDPYYDREQAMDFEQQFSAYVQQAEDADEPRVNTRLQSYQMNVTGGYSASYMQSHIGAWPSQFGGW